MNLVPFTYAELAFIAAYLLSLIGVGYWGYRARQGTSLDDFYLGGRGIGFVVLLLTLYATQYSGNTLLGFSGRAYKTGYAWAVSIHFMTAIVVFYLALAPRLQALASRHRFVTPGDYLQYRFQSPALTLVGTLLMIGAIANFLLAQLMAMGRVLEGLTAGVDPATAFTLGVIVLALIVVVYETLGGFRAVAWTDVIQGSVLIVGFAVLLVLVFQQYGSLAEATQILVDREQAAAAEDFTPADGSPPVTSPPVTSTPVTSTPMASKVQPPDWRGCLEWCSYVLIVGIGGALYPQAIQRIYAARDARTLRRTLAVMAFLPLTTALIALVVGIIGLAYEPGLASSDTILSVICRRIQEQPIGRWLVVVLFSAILAAIMSTADSVLLSISSMITSDVYGRHLAPGASQQQLTRVGKWCSWVLIAVLVVLAIRLRESTTLVQLLDRKFDLLVQLSPAFFIGLHWRSMRSGPTLAGMLVGVGIAVALAATGNGKLWGIHGGLYGLVVNLILAVGGSLLVGDRP